MTCGGSIRALSSLAKRLAIARCTLGCARGLVTLSQLSRALKGSLALAEMQMPNETPAPHPRHPQRVRFVVGWEGGGQGEQDWAGWWTNGGWWVAG